MKSMNFNTPGNKIRMSIPYGAVKRDYDFNVSEFYGANGEFMHKVTRTPVEPDGLFLNIIDWTGVNEKADRWGVLAALVYLDGFYQELKKQNKLTHPDVKKYLDMFNQLVTKRKVPIKYRPDKPIPGMITVAEMGKLLQTGETWHASTSSELSKYLKAELDKADAAKNQELHDELAAFYELASGFKVPKVTFKQVAKAVLTGGLTEPLGRKVVATVTTGGLNLTKPGQKLSEKIEKKAEKVEAKADVIAEKAGQLFKTFNLALPRAAFLSLALINVFGFSKYLQNIKESGEKGNANDAARWKKVRDLWYKIGGNRAKFDSAIKSGSKKKAFLAKIKKFSNADGSLIQEMYFKAPDEDGFFGPVTAAAVAAWVGIASGVIAAIKGIAGKPAEMDAESESIIDEDAARTQAEFDAAVAAEAANATPEFLRDFNEGAGGIPGWGWVGIIAGVLGIGYFTIRAIKRSRS
ncbi:MAG: hypothetical protein PHT07_15175 [Paludibacter sp.]|nr:hypothetical protein [Paludibacter sp.]